MSESSAPNPQVALPQGLMSLEEAQVRLCEAAAARRIRQTETLPTVEALGRVLAEDLISPLSVPPADNSAMDGYALRAQDAAEPGAELPVVQRIAAGQPGHPLLAGQAARIFTGALVPPGVDAVVMQEQCEAISSPASAGSEAFGRVRILAGVQAGQNVRWRGEDVAEGAVALRAGTRLTPQALGLAATVGAASLAVLRRPRVALFSTGDELTMPGQPLKPGGIYNSNRFTLRGLLEAAGCEVSDFGIVPDKLEATRAALREAAQGNDLILSSGGVSQGEEDHLRPAAAAEGRIELWQLAIKPGKPLGFGAIRRSSAGWAPESGVPDETLLIGLPGNPVSSFITFLLTAAPLLRALQGVPPALPVALPLRAAFDKPKADKRREFLRARVTEAGELALFPNQSSGVLTSAVWADGLIDLPAGQPVARGDLLRFLPFAALLAL